MSRARPLVTFFAFALAAGCDSGVESTSPRPPEPVSAYRTVANYRAIANVKQTMEWILDPAADVLWDSAGFIITAEGETDLQPTTDEGWAHVRNSAAVVAETGNLLMMPGRAAGPDWVAYAQGLTTAGEAAMAAASAHDAEALFDAGGQVYQACRACHEQYLVPLQEALSPVTGGG